MQYKHETHIVACEVFRYELEYLAERMSSPPSLHFLPQGLHDTPDKLAYSVQSVIDTLESKKVQEIRLCYGLCGRGISGIRPHTAHLLVPGVHDCIALLTGRYSEKIRDKSVYWMSAGWLEYSQLPFLHEKNKRKQQYTKRFGADSAAYLMEMEDQWLKSYSSACLILWDGLGRADVLREQARYVAKQAHLPYSEYIGSSEMLKFVLEGHIGNDGPVPLLCLTHGSHLDIDANGNLIVRRD